MRKQKVAQNVTIALESALHNLFKSYIGHPKVARLTKNYQIYLPLLTLKMVLEHHKSSFTLEREKGKKKNSNNDCSCLGSLGGATGKSRGRHVYCVNLNTAQRMSIQGTYKMVGTLRR